MTTDNFNPKVHEGIFPVRVLQNNIIQWFEEVSPELFDYMKDEIKFYGLNPGIKYHIDMKPINEIAEISNDGKIHLHENALAFI